MREILFRGKTEGGRWAYGSLILSGKYCCILEDEGKVHPTDYPYLDGDLGVIDGKATPVLPETVGQFTGLVDASGDRIFEGDVCKHSHLFSRTDIYEITFGNGTFSTRDIHRQEHYGTSFDDNEFGVDPSWLDIIGNIHDNPELLEIK